MENNNISELIEEGKKNLMELGQQLEKLANTAGKIANVAAEEGAKKVNDLMKDTEINADAAKEVVEKKAREVMDSDKYKDLEAEGKKILQDLEAKAAEMNTKANELSKELGDKFKNLFGSKQ